MFETFKRIFVGRPLPSSEQEHQLGSRGLDVGDPAGLRKTED